jgi:uroporphyrin-3 C-methyltransferase
MAVGQDKSAKDDERKLAELEKQLADKAAEHKVSQSPKSNAATNSPDQISASKAEPAATKSEPTTSKGTSSSPVSPRASSPSRASTSNQTVKAKTGLLWFFTTVNLLVLLTLIAGAYWAWQQWQLQQKEQSSYFEAQQNTLQQTTSANQLVKNELEQQNQALQSSLEGLLGQVQITTEQAEANKRSLADVSGRRPSDWLLAEADYLVRMAGRKLWLEQDEKTAILMLQSADSRLQDLDDPSLLPIRQQLAIDIQGLQQINPVSLSSIALALGGMAQQVDNLPLAMFRKPETIEEEQGVSESVSDWRANLEKNWREVTKDFFSVKRKQTEVKPFMSEQQQWLSREQLKLTLQQAKAAILQENNNLYQQSLQASLAQLIENFDTQKPSVEQFVRSLQNLLDTEVERVYPGQFSSAPMLQDLIDRRMENVFTSGDTSL